MKKYIKMLLLFSLLAALLLSLAACSKKKAAEEEDEEQYKTKVSISTVPSASRPAATQPTVKPTVSATVPATQPTVKPTVSATDPATLPTQSGDAVCTHTNATMKVDKEATCQEKGIQHLECPDCGYKGESATIDKIGHINSAWTVEKAATCLEEGKQYVECTMCKKRLASVAIPKTDHTVGEWILVKPATSGEPGEARQECDVCKKVLDTREIPATGSQGLIYKKNDDGKTYTITGIGLCKDTEIYIPSTYENCEVTAIGDQAFAGCTHVDKVVLPDTITSIGYRAFYKTGLKEFSIPASVKTLGDQIFYQADKLETVYYNSNSVEQTTSVFGATSVKKVVFGGTKIPDKVCQDAAKLTEVVIGDAVTEIGYYAFENCISLAQITIPSSVSVIGPGAFKNCTSLTDVVIPDSVSAIGEQTFEGCTALSSVTIPDSVIRINSRAFAGSGLAAVTIPVSVTSIGDEAFRDCTALETIEFMGTQAQWDKIPKGSNWDWNTGSYTVAANG